MFNPLGPGAQSQSRQSTEAEPMQRFSLAPPHQTDLLLVPAVTLADPTVQVPPRLALLRHAGAGFQGSCSPTDGPYTSVTRVRVGILFWVVSAKMPDFIVGFLKKCVFKVF